MPEIGQYILILAWVVSTYVIYVGWSAGKNNNREMAVSAYRGVWTVFGLLTLASIILVYLLAVRDFRVDYVVRYTSAKLPVFYAIPAFWAGNAGSLLLWVWLLSAFAALALYRHRHTASRLIPYVAMVCMMIATFFITLMLFLFREETGANAWFTTNPLYSALQTLFDTDGQVRPIANPFFTTPYIPTEGKGLNPQLQNPGMMFHPPTLYLGYVGLAIPFAFAMAALLVRRVDNTWLIMTRR
ncbi:MAG: cytochrome c biogenesis protein CcsA, partial [Candidatus Latescibacteria bacterium]|nr:cytochrome c biogenesis protein CcsA [Candidatus Latescibacterota bacterium]